MNNQMSLTGFEQETVKNMRIQSCILRDARMMADLVVEVAAKGAADGAEITCPMPCIGLAAACKTNWTYWPRYLVTVTHPAGCNRRECNHDTR